jgi:phospho-N-acetylmuramoyl-pentapeptide-transferase
MGEMTDQVTNVASGILPFLPFWVALIVAAILAKPILRFLLATKSRQTVSEYAPEGHQKKQGTPTMGGLIIVLGSTLSIVGYDLYLRFVRPFNKSTIGSAWNAWYAALLILLLGFATIGFVDDFVVPRLFVGKRGLGWKQKILMQVVFATLASGVMVGWKDAAQGALYVFLILFCSNAYNFLDGLDALAGSVLIALSGGLMVLGRSAPMNGYFEVVLLALIGATIPFLFLNAPPAKVFMGDVGSLPIGAVLGLVFASFAWPVYGNWTFYTPYSTLSASAESSSPQFGMWVPLLIIGLVLVAELVPVPLQIFWVKVFKKKLFPYTPIHHAFEKAGVAETRVVWHFLLVQLLLAAMAYLVLTGIRTGFDAPAGAGYYYQVDRPTS